MSATMMETGFAPSYCDDIAAKRGDDGERCYGPDLWLYRDRTIGLLKRYGRLSVEVGRLPSILGREFFRAKVTSYRAATFEDVVIFVHDVESSLEKLEVFERELIAKVVLEEYSHGKAAHLLGCGVRTVERRLPEALDRLSEIFLRGELLLQLPESSGRKACQEGKSDQTCISHCGHSE